MSLSVTPLVARWADRFGKMAVVLPGALVSSGAPGRVARAGSETQILEGNSVKPIEKNPEKTMERP